MMSLPPAVVVVAEVMVPRTDVEFLEGALTISRA
jgi:hypothetical protein